MINSEIVFEQHPVKMTPNLTRMLSLRTLFIKIIFRVIGKLF